MKKFILAVAVYSVLLAGCSKKDPVEYISKGNQLLASGNNKAALIEFKSALQEDPKLNQARLGLAKVYVDNREFDAAIGEINKVMDSLGKEALSRELLYPLLSRAYFLSDNGVQASEVPIVNSEEVAYYHVSENLLRGDVAGALEVQKEHANGKTAFTVMINVSILAAQKKADEASEMISKVVTVTEYEAAPFYMLKINAMLATRQIDKSIEAMYRYLENQPGDNTRSLMLSNLLVQENRMDDAKVIVDMLVEKFPQQGLINELRSVIAYSDENFELARSASVLASVSEPNSVRARIIHAYASARLNQREEAIEQLEFVIDELPPSHPAKRLYIQLKAETGDIKDVAKEVLALENLEARDISLISSVGLELVRNGRIEEARALSKKAQSVDAEGENVSGLGLLQLSLNEDGAFDTLENAFKSNPESVLAGNSLAAAYLSTGELKKARELGETWLTQGKVVQGNMMLGVVSGREESFSNALAFFEKANAASEEVNINSRSAIIETLIQLSETKKAKNKLDVWVTKDGGLQLMQGFVSAMRMVNKENGVKEAAAYIDLITQKHFIDNNVAGMMVAQAYYLGKEHEKAGSKLDSLKIKMNEDPQFWMMSASNNLQQGKPDLALEDYKSWIVLEPKNPMPLTGALRIYSASRDFKGGIALLDETLYNYDERGPGDLIRTQMLISDRQLSKAKTAHSRLPDDIKASIMGVGLRGILDYVDGDFVSAVEKITPMFEKVNTPEYLRWLVGAYNNLQKPEKSEVLLKSFIEKNPTSTMATFMLGNVYAGQLQFKKAHRSYMKALGSGDINPFLFNNAAYSKFKLGDYEEAEILSRKALNSIPGNASFADTLANILIVTGRKDEALSILVEISKNGKSVSPAFEATLKKASQ